MITIIDCGSKKTPEIGRIVSSFGVQTEIIPMENLSENVCRESQGIIISGAAILLTETDCQKYLDFFSCIKQARCPVLGICFGHQMVGMLYGGKICKDKECRQPIAIKMCGKDMIFEGLPDDPVFGEDHTESVSPPPDFEHIATSEFCKTEAIKHKNKPVYGVQFHPEISGENGKTLFKNFLKICKVLK
jgi:GMP synthase (glutamine-hydrolysing)